MKKAAAADNPEFEVVDSAFMKRVFYAFAALALLSVAISVSGKWLGRSIAMAGYTDDTSVRQIVIGNNVVAVPANYIRFEQARVDGIASRLDLYLRYPEMDGYSSAARDDFNHAATKKIIFMSFEPRMMSRDMSGRFAPIYSALIVKPGTSGPGGTTLYGFTEKSGYLNEVLAVADRPGKDPFVARCLSGPSAEESLAPCERDIQVGDDLSLTYRFPRELLGSWQALDAAIVAKVAGILKPGH
ncbi:MULTISPECIES: hypothetical protein [unclassified Mesorhizobium]|uniref:hypothetical protein n=1 Tax=unclassified Mesorhizobium TaxID=325217 RepID=UPI000BAEF4D8|nr:MULTISPECIES: hypothetical protein [unclassified Mesorhizobium]TGT60112.1 hypothetical protein EN813_026495 [Mesorhizobium sp. M00.F.Ca.ET.170.01.1.1]AZO08272.1 hypothetical protein EJ074_03395 [Mesorhizobium sp. M3A.F.Ca.ET.080.04.2.1]PBB85632.1 hypothetical protein CK216_15955 [Mesorhizobium sp. WSM3876]RWB72308.1 MAG: hypothetical protein EOQ49_13875 [Mesorhizobium sp.]RWB89291.1 MAG: hypothetical protein EOQ52_13055 [Mesorhizobium sp.]